MKRKFFITIYSGGFSVDTAEIELDQAVIDNVDDEFRRNLYDLTTPNQIAAHIAYNLIFNEIQLTQMDGWANLSNDMAKVTRYPSKPEYHVYAREVEETNERNNN